MSWSSRINDETRWAWCANNQCMNSLSIFWTWSSFSLLRAIWKGDAILLQELGQHVYLLLHTRAFSVISLIAVCTLAHFSFVLLLLVVLLGTLRLLRRLVLVSLLLRCLFRFFLIFESTLESPATRAWSLDGLMVPIITNLSCSCVRDSMKSVRLGIF